jgi:DNA-directed RNA polymerase sigma subunit (sigma70/sigma32)
MTDIVERLRDLSDKLLDFKAIIEGQVRSDVIGRAMQEAAAEIEILRSKLTPRPQFFLNEERTKKIRAMRAAGRTLDAIGFEFLLSKERVRQIIAKAERLERGEIRSADYGSVR